MAHPESRSDLSQAFNGASLSYDDLLAASDQRATALEFLGQGYEHVTD